MDQSEDGKTDCMEEWLDMLCTSPEARGGIVLITVEM